MEKIRGFEVAKDAIQKAKEWWKTLWKWLCEVVWWTSVAVVNLLKAGYEEWAVLLDKILVKRMIDEGHIVGNHTVNHKSMPEISDEQIEDEVMKLHQTIYEKYGYEMKYIRPPKGEFSERTLIKCNGGNN